MNPNNNRLAQQSELRVWCAAVVAMLYSFSVVSVVDASEARVVTSISKESIQVAEPLTVQWTVTAPTGYKVVFPPITSVLGDFEVVDSVDKFEIPTADSNSKTFSLRTWTREVSVECLTTGDLVVPGIEIQVSHAGSLQRLHSDSISVQVVSVLEERGDPTQFRDIKPVIDVSVPRLQSRAWIWWTLGSLLGLAILALVVVPVVHRRPYNLKPVEWAHQQLDELQSSVAKTATDNAAAMERLSHIVRGFLLMRLEIQEPGWTSHDLLASLDAAQGVDNQTTARLADLFDRVERATFSGLSISSAQLENAINDSREIIGAIGTTGEQMKNPSRSESA
ncbi:MAG: DUF4381 family protein [Pirellulaceae bacterium]